MKKYDFDKAKQIIAENLENLESASLGMHEDWWWTADTIWSDGSYRVELNSDSKIGGIIGSTWATPTIELCFKDGSIKMLRCHDDGESTGSGNIQLGVLSQPCQDNITPLEQ